MRACVCVLTGVAIVPTLQVRYLTKDLSILCDSPQQKTAEATAGFMLVVFSIGLPALYLAMLVRHRPPLNAAGGREHAACASGLYETMAFFHNDYAPDLYYWEVVELVRKLVLTAVTVQFPKVQYCSICAIACSLLVSTRISTLTAAPSIALTPRRARWCKSRSRRR